MKKILFPLLFLLVKMLPAQKEHKIAAPVDAVIVYLDGAEITSNKALQLAAGRNEITFEGISSMLNP
jgi:hypothetical protein